ncbi:hypothetical protein KC323_g65 [Hortaea werneckii]|nr:hypothetical protein KC323_g65 [Hortaea werneckii]
MFSFGTSFNNPSRSADLATVFLPFALPSLATSSPWFGPCAKITSVDISLSSSPMKRALLKYVCFTSSPMSAMALIAFMCTCTQCQTSNTTSNYGDVDFAFVLCHGGEYSLRNIPTDSAIRVAPFLQQSRRHEVWVSRSPLHVGTALGTKNVNSVPESFLFKRVERLYVPRILLPRHGLSILLLRRSERRASLYALQRRPFIRRTASGESIPRSLVPWLLPCVMAATAAAAIGLSIRRLERHRNFGIIVIIVIASIIVFVRLFRRGSCVVSIGSVGFGESAVISTPIVGLRTLQSWRRRATRRTAMLGRLDLQCRQGTLDFLNLQMLLDLINIATCYRQLQSFSPDCIHIKHYSAILRRHLLTFLRVLSMQCLDALLISLVIGSGSSISVNSTLSTLQPTSCNSVGIIPRPATRMMPPEVARNK